MTRTSPLAILCALSLIGCEQAPGGPAGPPVPATTPRFNFLNGPPAPGPNVIRYADNSFGVLIEDDEANLVAIEGLPADPRDVFLCDGGTEELATIAVQNVGLLRDIIHTHIRGDDVPIHVYSLSGFDGDILGLICTGTPIASGFGRMMVTDNGNTAGFHIAGTLTDLATGGLVRLTAVAQQMVLPDGTLRVMTVFVRLRPSNAG